MNKLLLALTLIATFFANQAIALAPCDELEMIKHNCQSKVNQNLGNYSGVYDGEFMNGKRNGQGTFSFEDGVVYRGQWKDDNFHGQGDLYWPSGAEHSGEFRNGNIIYGKYTWASGQEYVGEFKGGRPDGKGTFIFISGVKDKYVGEVKEGEMHGKGTMTYLQSTLNPYKRDKYVGEWKRNLEHGMGIMTYKDGSSYEGLFKGGGKDLTYEQKKIKADKEKALAKTKNDKERKRNIAFAEKISFQGGEYSGDLKDGVPHGNGTLTYSNGDIYVGGWKEGYQHGQGTLISEGLFVWSEATKYEGEWKWGKKINTDKANTLAKDNKERKMKLQLETTCANKAGKASNDFAAKKIYESCMAANK